MVRDLWVTETSDPEEAKIRLRNRPTSAGSRERSRASPQRQAAAPRPHSRPPRAAAPSLT